MTASYEFVNIGTMETMSMTRWGFQNASATGAICFIYTRQSSTRQNSLEEQKMVCLNHAKTNGYNFAVVFKDKASAWKKGAMESLKSLNLMVRYISLFVPRVVYISDVSRFGRDVYSAISLLEKIRKHEINIESVMDNRVWSEDNMSKDDFTQSILEARKFSTMLSERIQQRNRMTVSSGGRLGNPGYGKMAVRIRGVRKFQKQPDEHAIIQQIKDWKGENRTFNDIAALLNQTSTKRGKMWTKNLVSSINLDFDEDMDTTEAPEAPEAQETTQDRVFRNALHKLTL